MFILLNYFFLNILWTVFVSASDSVNVPNYDSQENYSDTHLYNETSEDYLTSNNVFYWLYTRDYASGQLLNRNEPRMIESTTYNENHPIKVVVHGWLGNTQEKNGLCSHIVKSYLMVGEYNVICVDWKRRTTDLSYATAKVRAKHVSNDIAMVLTKITDNLTKGVKNMHLIGHSMGAHIVGFVGKNLVGRIPRITGLDPAKPGYEHRAPEERLCETDAHFVDVIHTNSAKNGIDKSIGHIDFFPNGGKSQPGCGFKDKMTGSCSHIKSYHYFAHSIWAKEDYVALKCSSWEEYNANECDNAESTFMGEHVAIEKIGEFYLKALVDDP